jgi:serine/threonine protein kinase
MDSRIPALTSTTRSGGSTRWQAPELFRGSRNSAASDVYAFACVCYEVSSKVHSSVSSIPKKHYRYSRRKFHFLKLWSPQSCGTSTMVTSRRNYPASRTISGPSWKSAGEPNRGNVLRPNKLLRGSVLRPLAPHPPTQPPTGSLRIFQNSGPPCRNTHCSLSCDKIDDWLQAGHGWIQWLIKV